MVVGGDQRSADLALQPLRQRNEPRQIGQRQRLVEPGARARLKPQQRRVAADQLAAPVDPAANDALAHRARPPSTPDSSRMAARACSTAA